MKIIPVLVILLIYPKIINEPFDLVIYASIAALGFSFHENILYVFRYGYGVIPGRSIISSPFHMFCSSIFIYGIVLYKFNKNLKFKFFSLIIYPLLAITSHGLFDFFLIVDYSPLLPFVSLLFFMLLVSVFAVIINNCLNQSSHFTPKMVVDATVTSKLMFQLHGILLALYIIGCFFVGSAKEIENMILGISKLNAIFVLIMVTRLTRIKLIQNEWFPVRFELPIYIANKRIQIKGDGFDETFINQYLEQEIKVFPCPIRYNPDRITYNAYIQKKFQTRNLETCYLIKIFNSPDPSVFEYYLLNPKKNGISEFNTKNPIAALLKIDNLQDMVSTKIELFQLPFVSWVKIIPISNSPI